jgi:PAS domain S-box-containing protein
VDRLRRLVNPRPFTPEEREHLARHLTITLRLAVMALPVGTLIALFWDLRTALGVAGAGAPVYLALRLAKAGRVSLASLVLIPSMLALGTWLLSEADGLQDIAILLYPVIVLVAAMLVERRPFALVVLAMLLSLGYVAWGQSRGFIRVRGQTSGQEIVLNLVTASLLLVVLAVIVSTLVEDLRESLRSARRSEERYRLISEVSSDYTFSSIVDAEGRVRQDWVAGAFERMTGYTFEEFMARGGWRAALHPDDHARDDRDLAELQANRPVVTELRTITRGGEVRFVRVYGHPVWSEAEGRLTGIYGAVQDITERKQAEAERERLIRELAAKNAELERFTYTASHDLKSPLLTVRGFLGYVERDALAGNHERLKADLHRIREATDKMGRQLDELLELSRVGRVVGPGGPIRFGELVREALSLVAGRLAERKVEVRVAEDLPVVWGDRVRLLQVVQNLLDNAVKFLGPREDPVIEVAARERDGQMVLYVRDNGVGIEPRHHERVFGLFDKLEPESAGTGVGLALVRRIVEIHGGRVWVESEGRGRGSTFCLTLPTTAPPPKAAAGGPEDRPPSPRPGG